MTPTSLCSCWVIAPDRIPEAKIPFQTEKVAPTTPASIKFLNIDQDGVEVWEKRDKRVHYLPEDQCGLSGYKAKYACGASYWYVLADSPNRHRIRYWERLTKEERIRFDSKQGDVDCAGCVEKLPINYSQLALRE